MTCLRGEDDAAAVSLPVIGQLLRSLCQGLHFCTSKLWSMQMAGSPGLVVYVRTGLCTLVVATVVMQCTCYNYCDKDESDVSR